MLRNRQEDLVKFCKDYGVLLQTKETGRHYLLSSGEHTDEVFQFAIGFKDAEFRRIIAIEIMEELGKLRLLNQNDDNNKIGVILTPALGGILLGGTLQHLFYGKKPILLYAEKINGKFCLKRNFFLPKNQGILIVDDVYTTGKTISALTQICQKQEDAGPIMAKAAVINRNFNNLPLAENIITQPHVFLIRYPLSSFLPLFCPFCKDGMPLEKDGVLVDRRGSPLKT